MSMSKTYPPDADFEDCFLLGDAELKQILAAFDAKDTDLFDELVEQFVSDEDDLGDILRWWGRA